MQIRQQRSNSSKFNRVIDSDKLDQIIAAIIAGKYSWACVLILRFAGYNPLQYIPYRTYNRLMKKNSQQVQQSYHDSEELVTSQKSAAGGCNCAPMHVQSERTPSSKPSYQIGDLSYLEVVNRQDQPVRGGRRILPVDENLSIKDFEFALAELAA